MAKKTKASEIQSEVREAANSMSAESLTSSGKSPIIGDPASNAAQLVEWGWPRLAADHFLFPDLNGRLTETVSNAFRRLSYRFALSALKASDSKDVRTEKIQFRINAYEFALELALNFFGLESGWLDEWETELSVSNIEEVLLKWESMEIEENGAPVIAFAAVDKILKGMELVQGGASMTSLTGKRIRAAVAGDGPVTLDFLDAAADEIFNNIYFKMSAEGVCKFGNDYALGLRWLRHLGFEQVSTNPVLAAKAYDDDPALTEKFIKAAAAHPMREIWRANPSKHSDEIALFATLLALWDNLHVFRPVFHNLRDESGGGVVSFQLNPNIAHKADESIADALNALKLAEENLRVYDSYLLAGYESPAEKGRANLVIKVAACHPAARKIARSINSFGLGSNVTVVYTVAQQVAMILEEIAGMASAMNMGILPTQLYMTNMGGRFESHLREVKLESLFASLKKKIGAEKALKKVMALAKANGSEKAAKSASNYEAAVVAATRFSSQKTIDANVASALKDIISKTELEQIESDIAKSGTLVARRVWHIFFSERNYEKWSEYICDTYDLGMDQARFIMDRINYLPASKRKPEDTYWTLAANNMVHTEFGNHQENVRKMSLQNNFKLNDYVESIRDDFGADVVDRLSSIPDFVAGYELNAELKKILGLAGIDGDFGVKGHTPAQWPEFGSIKKTLAEFKAAYDAFSARMLKEFEKA